MTSRSALFQPYRTVGYVCGSLPAVVQRLGRETFATVSIGRAFQVYNLDKLRLTIVSKRADGEIRAIATRRDLTFTAVGREIVVWKRGKQVTTVGGEEHEADVSRLLLIGTHLLSVDEEGVACVWDAASSGNTDELDPGAADAPLPLNVRSANSFPLLRRFRLSSSSAVTAVSHPHTYLNKVVVGYASGRLELWNIRKGRLVHTFDHPDWPAVTCVEQSPAVDVVAVGLRDGRCVLLNLRFDEAVATFRQDDGAVTAVSFRTDGKAATMATGGPEGHLSVWDLAGRKLATIVRDAHAASVSSVHFLADQPVMLTTGADNAARMWIFDRPDSSARMLRSREGHSEAPTRIRFHGRALLSAGRDRALRTFSVLRDQQSTELSQGALRSRATNWGVSMRDLRMPPVVDFAVSEARERDWANVVTCHEGTAGAPTWSYDNRKLAKHRLHHRQRAEAVTTAVALSGCGNFGVIGTEDGRVERYNMQSGFYRGSYGHDDGVVEVGQTKWGHRKAKEERGGDEDDGGDGDKAASGHTGAVLGVAVDGLNRFVVSAGYDGSVRFWDFTSRKLLQRLDLGSPVASIAHSRDSDLLAVCTDDLAVRVFDCVTRRVVRLFRGHRSRVSDMAFSPDSRWLVTSCMDGGVRVFDLPSGRLVDWFTFERAVTSLAFSPNGDFLATTHAGNLGIYLWANRSYFSAVFLRTVPGEPVDMDLPAASDARGRAAATSAESAAEAARAAAEAAERRERRFDSVGFAPVPLETEAAEGMHLVTLSALPKSRWQDLPHLDVIKERNKPLEAPKAPEQAPFFLATALTASGTPEFVPGGKADGEEGDEDEEAAARSHLLRTRGERSVSRFVSLLRQAQQDPTRPGAVVAAPAARTDKGKKEEEEDEEEEAGRKRTRSSAGKGRAKRARRGKAAEAEEEKREEEAEEDKDQQQHQEEKPNVTGASDRVCVAYRDAFLLLKGMSPAAIDAEIRLLGGDIMSEADELEMFLDFLLAQVSTSTNFEFVQAVLNLFLQVHGEGLVKYPDLVGKLRRLGRAQHAMWKRLESSFHGSICLLNHFSRTQV